MPLRACFLIPLIAAVALAQAPAPFAVPEDRIAQLKEMIRNDPNNIGAHQQLAMYYGVSKQGAELVPEVVWLVMNHPEAAGVSHLVHEGPDAFTTPADFALVKAAWESALATSPGDWGAYSNAATFFQNSDPARTLELLGQARTLAPDNDMLIPTEAAIYRKAIEPDAPDLRQIAPLSPEQAAAWKAALGSSSDAKLVGTVGEQLSKHIRPPQACSASCQPDNDAIKALALQYLQQAAKLQPNNPEWPNDITFVGQIASGLVASPDRAQHVGAQVMEANLIRKVNPVYPPLAMSARVQGTVEFLATIDEAGHVVSLMLVRGHPLLVNAAREAVLQWLYRPTLLNGQPVTVATNVVVNFSLDTNPAAPPAQPPK